MLTGDPPPPRAGREEPYHAGLQGLRGILALGVFAQHAFFLATRLAPGPTDTLYALNLGGLSVLTFFALSGFLMAGKASDPPRVFLLDRLRRIAPTYWLALAVAALTLAASGGPVPDLWPIALLLPTGAPNPLPLPHWSLYFEAFFYVLVPAVAAVRVSWVRPTILAWGAAGLVLYERPYAFENYNAPDPFSLVFSIFALFFAAGTLAGWRHVPTRGQAGPYALAALAAFYGLQASAWVGLPVHAWVSRWVRPQDFAFALIALGALFAVRAALGWQPRSRVGRTLVFLGDASYGIYLFHMVCLEWSVWLFEWLHAPRSYWVVVLLLWVLALPAATLFGVLDVRLQRVLKALQRRARARAAERPGRGSHAAAEAPSG